MKMDYVTYVSKFESWGAKSLCFPPARMHFWLLAARLTPCKADVKCANVKWKILLNLINSNEYQLLLIYPYTLRCSSVCLDFVCALHTYTHMRRNCTHSKRRNYIHAYNTNYLTSHGGESKSWVMQNRCWNAGTDNDMFKAAAFREHKFSTNNTRELPWIMKGQHKYA